MSLWLGISRFDTRMLRIGAFHGSVPAPRTGMRVVPPQNTRGALGDQLFAAHFAKAVEFWRSANMVCAIFAGSLDHSGPHPSISMPGCAGSATWKRGAS